MGCNQDCGVGETALDLPIFAAQPLGIPLPGLGTGVLGDVTAQIAAGDSAGDADCGCDCAGGGACDGQADESPAEAFAASPEDEVDRNDLADVSALDGFGPPGSVGEDAADTGAPLGPLTREDEIAPEGGAGPEGNAASSLAAAAGALPASVWAALRDQLLDDLVRLWGEPSKHCGEVVGIGGTFEEDFYGDGSDGDVVTNANWEITRDTYYNNLTVSNGFWFRTHGFRLFVKGKLTIESTGLLHCNGGDGGLAIVPDSGLPGAAGPDYPSYGYARGGTAASGYGGTGGNSVAGTVTGTAAAGGTGEARVKSFGPTVLRGGCGGGGGAYCGAAGGTEATAGYSALGADGGAGGAATSDGSSVNLYGGGGGGGAGVLFVYAREIDNAGAMRANGGAGGQVSGANQAGAGGGGGGGAVVVYYTTSSGSGLGTTSAAAGATGGTGGAGGAGGAGVVLTYQVKV